ncbi:putative leucine-rich repeat-containing protein DDB_G0290503 [Calliphora vicina]|uniref:putative leucine-rich repeat-containing protein DDB_G0290503 n=1 Tax=Calliphora vicina TaxID=7373 RepID=UPI00325B98F5
MSKLLQHYMAHKSQNFKFTCKQSVNKPPTPTLGKTQKFRTYCDENKENSLPSEMPPSPTNSFQKFKQYTYSDDNFEKLDEETPHHLLESADNNFKTNQRTKRHEMSAKLKEELSKYRNELREYTNSTKDLQEKYMKINSELNEMKLKHNSLLNNRNLPCGDFDTYSDSSFTGTEYSLQRKYTEIFHHSNSFIHMLSNEQPLKEIKYKLKNLPSDNYHKGETIERRVHQQSDNKENVNPVHTNDNSLQNVYLALKTVIDDQSKSQPGADVFKLKNTIAKLQNDSERFSSIIEDQQNTLSDYRKRFVKAQQLMQEQQLEIEKLNCNNQQLETDASVIIDQLRHRIDTKLRDVDLLSDMMREEQLKRERVAKENCILNKRLEAIQAEANQLKIKLEEMSRRKMTTISRLKVAERDLKIFKNYNADLKQEKRKLNEQLKSMGEQIGNMQNANKRTMNRQREQNEKQRRELQKRIFELEMKLNRNQNSTTSLIKERDSLIAELQSQLNSLVHNFEVSQKHIRVLRKHIYTMCGNNNSRQAIIRNRGMGETV